MFIPDQPLSAFNGQNAVGNWILRIYDNYHNDVGFVNWFCVSFEYDYILAVELASFDAVAGDGRITLNWRTASETANDHFEILRDGVKVAEQRAQNHATGGSYSWSDATAHNGTTYTYTLIAVDIYGARKELGTVSATPSVSSAAITEYALSQNYPNPFNPTTSIAVDLVETGNVTLKVYNLVGQEVASLMSGPMTAGRHIVNFDAAKLSSGIYLYRLSVNGFVAEKKMLLMK